MPSKTDICNYALGLIAEDRIQSIDDANEPARLCKLHLDATIREVLRDALWRSCRKRAALTQDTTAPAFGWTYYYSLPVDFIRMVSINDTDIFTIERDLYEVEGKKIATNETIAKIIYIFDITQESGGSGYNNMDPMLTEAVYTKLAAKLAWQLQQSRTLRESILQQYMELLRKAKGADARDGFDPLPARGADSGWIQTRLS